MKGKAPPDIVSSLLASLSSRHLLKELLAHLQREQGLQLDQVISLYMDAKQERVIPLSIFSTKLYPVEALCKYLKEEEKLSYAEIAQLLQKNTQTVWASCQRARKTVKKHFGKVQGKYSIPLLVLQDSSLTITEHIVFYLHAVYNLSNPSIAEVLHKSPNSIAVLFKRAREKKHGTS